METKANYVVVGAFTVLVLAAAFAAVYWIARVDTGGESARLEIEIEGSVTGLGVGSLVKFNGIDVGKVVALRFQLDNPDVVIVTAQVNRNIPITRSTRAVLAFTGLTGIAHIEFEGGSIDEQNVFALAEEQGTTARISADPSAFNDILATAQDIFTRVDNVLTELESFVTDARVPLDQTLQNTAAFTEALANNSEGIDTFLASVGDIGETLETVSVGLDQVLGSVDELVKAVEPDQVRSIVANVETFTATLEELSNDLQSLTQSAEKTIAGFENSGTQVTEAFDKLDDILSAVEPEQINKTIDEVAKAGQATREAAENIAGIAADIGQRRDDINGVIDDVAEMAQRLNAASARVDGVLSKLDGFLGDGDSGDLFAQARETLASFKGVADTLNSRLDGITSGLERFSGRGLREVEALVAETRRSISRIERAITSLERDPQRLLFGGDSDVKRFDGRQRR